jgi:hypothetical protein
MRCSTDETFTNPQLKNYSQDKTFQSKSLRKMLALELLDWFTFCSFKSLINFCDLKVNCHNADPTNFVRFNSFYKTLIIIPKTQEIVITAVCHLKA